jgi:glycosyltransferase involved in cell wall biosynthesis
MPPQITAILPTFRRPRFLKKAIESILHQTYDNFLIWVFDNASQDETQSLVLEFSKKDPRVSYFCHEQNIGMQENFRFALHQVKTPFVSFVSDDDFLFPWFYQEAMEKLSQFPKAAFFSGTTVIVDENDQFVNWEKNQMNKGYWLSLEKKFSLPTRYWISSLFRTSISQRMDFHTRLLSFDLDFLARTCCQYPFYVSEKPCAGYRSHSTSFGVTLQSRDFFPSFLEAKNSIRQDLHLKKNMKDQIENYMTQFYQSTFFMQGIKSLVQKNYKNTKDAAQILQKTFHAPLRSSLLILAAIVFQKSFLLYQIACYLLSFRRKMKIKKRKKGLFKECSYWIEKFKMDRA